MQQNFELDDRQKAVQERLKALGFKMVYKPDANTAEGYIPPFGNGWVAVPTDGPAIRHEDVPPNVRQLAVVF